MDWPTYLMGFAQHAATKSKDSTQVGAILVGPNDRTVLLTAYNGPPAGAADLPERRERPAKYLFASHAEANLVAFAARQGIRTDGCSVFVTHHPCAACARTLIQAGVRSVIYGSGQTSMPAAEFEAAAAMFAEAGIASDPLGNASGVEVLRTDPDVLAKLRASANRDMTAEESQAQRRSFIIGQIWGS